MAGSFRGDQVHKFEATPEELLGPLNEVERKNAPERLFLSGHRGLFAAGPRVSVVGTRKLSREGAARAARLTRALVQRGAVVVSGLAEGIDTVAHTTALEAGGKTIAVLGTPLDQCFPASNRGLQERIMREQLAVSQFSRRGDARTFPIRNRTMALLTEVTVIVEAGQKSGTAHQGWEALRLGRLLYLLESLAARKQDWTEELIRYGAQILSDANKEEFLESLPERSSDQQVAF